ncbi:MAG: branched-chain amino acid ABC transporter permease, partial [Thermodesulfobacteriota bacterium]|nr:branched-chain amino acid ABC transporter permease [Thermodesulfobacteriota bacterium]
MSHYIILLYYWLRGELFAIPGRVIAAVFFILLFILPLINQEPYMLRILSLAAIYSIFATSWNLLAGYVGQISLGHALFFGVPAYVVAMLDTHLGLSPWLTITGGGLTGILMGFIAGFPVLRLKGVYLSLVTLTFPIILTGIIFAFPDFTGGELGIFGLSRLSDSRINDYYMVIITMI